MSVAPSAPPIEAHGLRKSYRGRPAVDGIDLLVRPGEIYGFLGPNGAGKTTTMRMLLGLIRPDAGTIRLFGRETHGDALAARARVAGIIEEPRLYTYLSGRRNLRLLASYDRAGAGPEVIEEALEMVELRDRAADRVSDYSQGMRQRLGVAACLVRRPQLLLLDEPANGLDPAGIRFLRRLLRDLSARGVTVFLSSHLLAEVQELCERVAIVIAWGFNPLVNISGHRISALHALGLDIVSLLVYTLPVLAIASFGVFLSVVTGQSVPAVGGTIIYAMALQGVAAISSIQAAHPYLLTNQRTAWHDLFQTPTGGALILRAIWVSAAFALPPIVAALVVFNRRDVVA